MRSTQLTGCCANSTPDRYSNPLRNRTELLDCDLKRIGLPLSACHKLWLGLFLGFGRRCHCLMTFLQFMISLIRELITNQAYRQIGRQGHQNNLGCETHHYRITNLRLRQLEKPPTARVRILFPERGEICNLGSDFGILRFSRGIPHKTPKSSNLTFGHKPRGSSSFCGDPRFSD